MRTLLSIQYLRGFAALAVVAYHACQWIMAPVSVGAAGVDVFFVISGFIMWTTTWEAPISPARFAWRRLTRVAPLYWVLTLALAAAATALPGVFPHVTPQPLHVVKSMLFIAHYNPEGAAFPLLAVGWTLVYEMVFYLAFTVALAFPRSQRMAWLSLILVPISCFGLMYLPAYTMLANPMLLQFLAGAAVGRLYLQRALPGRTGGWIALAAAAVLFAVSHLIGVVPESLMRPLEWGAPATMLVLGAVCIEADGGVRSSPILKRLGDASFSIYLIHTPVMALFNKAIGPTHPALFFTLAMILSVAAGLACHHWLEQPLLALFRRRGDRGPLQGGLDQTAPGASRGTVSPPG